MIQQPENQVKILYVCPWAHHAGHYPYAAVRESVALYNAGSEVCLCTFKGILDDNEPEFIPQRKVTSSRVMAPLVLFARALDSLSMTRGAAGFVETFATLLLAMQIRKKVEYDVIYLRNGIPFVFLPFLFGLIFKNMSWILSQVDPVGNTGSLYSRFVNNPVWKPVYRKSLTRNQFAFLCENMFMKNYFSTGFLEGIMAGRIRVIPLGLDKTVCNIATSEARNYLGLPDCNMTILLHFGAIHGGKDMDTVIKALKGTNDVILIHAGKITSSSTDLFSLVENMQLGERVFIHDHYISEDDKDFYFAAADAMILSYKKDFHAASMLWEAARYNLPVITSDHGEFGGLVREYEIGNVFEPENPDSLKNAVISFKEFSDSKKQLTRENCQKFCDEFSMENWAEKFLEFAAKMN